MENIEDLAIGNDVGLNEPLLFLFNANENMSSPNAAPAAAAGGNPLASSARAPGAGMSSYLPTSIKGLNTSSKTWMKNILDTSTKVINEGVQQVKQ